MEVADIFQSPNKKIPKEDSRIVRIGMDKSDLGARKSQLARAMSGSNTMTIAHVKSGS